MSQEKIQYSWAFQPSKKVFSIGLYLVGKRQENLSKEAKNRRPRHHVAAFHNEGPTFFGLKERPAHQI